MSKRFRSTRLLWFVPVLLLAVPAWLWFTLLSPWGYERPAHLPAIAPGSSHELFVYGTLRKPWVRWLVTGSSGDTRPAILPGYRRTQLDITPDPNARVEGEVWQVDAQQLRRLDRYERLGVRYERVRMRLADGDEVWVYRRLPESRP
jgi:gamma-glutamylcyclotransferase (GGCT)/AIG2-like uncharacterized protein YtfP